MFSREVRIIGYWTMVGVLRVHQHVLHLKRIRWNRNYSYVRNLPLHESVDTLVRNLWIKISVLRPDWVANFWPDWVTERPLRALIRELR